jgi:hypothetical protein
MHPAYGEIETHTMTGTMPTEYMGSLIAAFHSCCWVGPAGSAWSLDAEVLLQLILRTRCNLLLGAMRLQFAGLGGVRHLLRGNSCAILRSAEMTTQRHQESLQMVGLPVRQNKQGYKAPARLRTQQQIATDGTAHWQRSLRCCNDVSSITRNLCGAGDAYLTRSSPEGVCRSAGDSPLQPFVMELSNACRSAFPP